MCPPAYLELREERNFSRAAKAKGATGYLLLYIQEEQKGTESRLGMHTANPGDGHLREGEQRKYRFGSEFVSSLGLRVDGGVAVFGCDVFRQASVERMSS